MATNVTPMQATTDKKIRLLSHDNIEAAGGYGALLEPGVIHIHQPDGSSVTIQRKAFDDIVMWYTHGLIPKCDKRRKPQ